MLKTAFEKLFQMREKASRLRPGADDGYDAHEKPFLDHLEDLRHTLIRIIATLSISTLICFAFHKQIFQLVQLPAKMPMANISDGVTLSEKLDLITLGPPEFLVLMLKLSFYGGIIISFPINIYFLFQFILPGLRQAEKRAVIPGALIGFILFLVGVVFAFCLAAPIALKFFYVFENENMMRLSPIEQAMEKKIENVSLIGVDGERWAPVKNEEEKPTAGEDKKEALTPELKSEIRDYIRNSFATIESSNLALRYDPTRDKLVLVEIKGTRSVYRIGEYIAFISRLVLVFGISFQLPVVVAILVRLELLTARVMRSTRSYAWIIILVASAILTPPDVLTLALLGGPMIFLYEVCIIIATVIERKREKRERAEEESRRSRLEHLYSKPSDELTEEEKQELHRAEIEQYEKEHAHLYEEESDHGTNDGIVSRDSFHGGEHPHEDDPDHANYDESWHADDHYWHDGHEDDPDLHDHHASEDEHEPVQDWPDHPDGEMESDHAEPVDLEPGEEDESSDEEAVCEGNEEPEGEESDESNPFHDEESCEPSGPLVDLNHATMEELMTLPGITDEIAQGILDHRPFETFDHLNQVPGLTDEMVNAMIDRLMLG